VFPVCRQVDVLGTGVPLEFTVARANLSTLRTACLKKLQLSARAWLKEPAKALGGQTPLAYLGTEVGAAEVHRLIARLGLGIYP